jgi:hypothetical protein
VIDDGVTGVIVESEEEAVVGQLRSIGLGLRVQLPYRQNHIAVIEGGQQIVDCLFGITGTRRNVMRENVLAFCTALKTVCSALMTQLTRGTRAPCSETAGTPRALLTD